MTVVSSAYYHRSVPSAPTVVDAAALASQLRFGITRLARKLRREGDTGITPTLLTALSTIDRHGPMTPGTLAVHEQVEKPTVTRLLAALEQRALVERTSDPFDRRIAWIQTTSEGRKLLQRTRRRKDEYLARRIKGLTPEEQITLEQAAELLECLTDGDR